MKHKIHNAENLVYRINESVEILFDKIKDWEITSQVKFTVEFENPKRKQLFEMLIESVTNEVLKQNIILISNRIEQAAIQIPDYTPSEIEHYQSIYAKDFLYILHSDNYQVYIEDKIRDLHFYCKKVEKDIEKYTECERYKLYLERLYLHLKNNAETKEHKLTAPLLGLFCNIIHSIGVDKKDATEIASVYCKRICEKFNFKYTDRVRQNYGVKQNTKLTKDIKEKLLPLIDNETRELIQNYLDRGR